MNVLLAAMKMTRNVGKIQIETNFGRDGKEREKNISHAASCCTVSINGDACMRTRAHALVFIHYNYIIIQYDGVMQSLSLAHTL